MLVNHLAKRHPDVAPESVPELNLPILRQTRDYYCQYCDKVSSDERDFYLRVEIILQSILTRVSYFFLRSIKAAASVRLIL